MHFSAFELKSFYIKNNINTNRTNIQSTKNFSYTYTFEKTKNQNLNRNPIIKKEKIRMTSY